MNRRKHQLQLYITTASGCSYFDERMSSSLVPDPEIPLTMPLYDQLIRQGFRRSGEHVYRPHCKNCVDCVACRIPVKDFRISRSQKRCLKTNQDLTIATTRAEYSDEYFELYCRYLNSRHTDSSMANPTEEEFKQFLYCHWCNTQFIEVRLDKKLVGIAVTDMISDGVSAVYSFFDPEMKKRSLGTYCILKQIEYARNLGLAYVYLGYWIENHNKMHYKNNFKPLEMYLNERWQVLET